MSALPEKIELAFTLCLLAGTAAMAAQQQLPSTAPPSFELLTHRMDVDVDGAPRAYGPTSLPTLDFLKNAHFRRRRHGEIVGFLTDDDDPTVPIVQGPHDPAPGYYISQTAFTDPARTDPRDVTRYVDASAINYIVLGNRAHKLGARLGDFVAVYSRRTHRAVYGIVADDGNPSGNEGSLHLLQALGYHFHDGKDDAVERPEIVVRFYPGSNPRHEFFRSQAALNTVAARHGVSLDFSASPLAAAPHPKH